MTAYRLCALILLLLTLVQLPGYGQSAVAQSHWLEAECATVGDGWLTVEDPAAAGGKYLVHVSGISLNDPPREAANQLLFSVNVGIAGNFYLQARIRAASGTEDSFWVKIDDGPWIKWWENITRGSQFAWNQAPGAPFFLDAGAHTVTVAYRESGTQLDKIALNPTADLPSGLGEIASCQTDEPTPSVATWREAECARVGTNWTLAEDATASGGKYAVYPSGKSLDAPPTAAADQLLFDVDIDQPQPYFLWARLKAPSLSSNSIWVRIDDQPWIKWWQGIVLGDEFAWNVLPGGSLSLDAGRHTITVAYREAGTQLDKLSLSSSAASPRGTGETDGDCNLTSTPVIAALADTVLTVGEPYQQVIRAGDGEALGTRVVVLGSSTAAGTGATAGQGWVDLLRSYLLTQEPVHQLFNLAVGGYTTRDVLVTGRANHNITQALSLSPSVILVNLPSNDVARNISDEESMANFVALRETADAAGVPIYFTTTQPRNFSSTDKRQQLAAQAAQIKNLFAPYAIDIYGELADSDRRIRAQYGSGDGIHLNNAGHQFIFTQVRTLFDGQEDPIELTVSGLPAFLTFTPQGSGRGILEGMPTAADVGTYGAIVITATQGGRRSQRTVSLTVEANSVAGGTLVLAPNPTQDYAKVLTNDQATPGLSERPLSESFGAFVYHLLLYGPRQELLLDKFVTAEPLEIDTRSLPTGHYPLRVYRNGSLIFAEQLIVE